MDVCSYEASKNGCMDARLDGCMVRKSELNGMKVYFIARPILKGAFDN